MSGRVLSPRPHGRQAAGCLCAVACPNPGPHPTPPAQLACSPLTQVTDPRRSSVVSAASVAAATQGVRSVSPRDVVERVLFLREHIAKEMQEELGGMASANSNVMRMCGDGAGQGEAGVGRSGAEQATAGGSLCEPTAAPVLPHACQADSCDPRVPLALRRALQRTYTELKLPDLGQ